MVKAKVQTTGEEGIKVKSGMVVTDLRGVVVAVSAGMMDWLGFAMEELIGEQIDRLCVSNVGDIQLCKRLKQYQYWQGEIDCRDKDGNIHTSRAIVFFVSGQQREWVVWHLMKKDVCANEQNELSSLILQTIYNSAPLAIVPIRSDGTVQQWGKSAEEVFGRKREEVVGRPFSALFQMHNVLQPASSCMDGRKEGEGIVQKNDGTIVHVSYTCIEIPGGNGYIVLAQDVTDRKRKEEERRRQVELAKNVQRSLLTPPLHNEAITMDAVYIPSDDLSGDIYACYQIDLHRYGVIIIDVMGHGISSALVSMLLRSLLRGLIVRVIDPVSVAGELEKHVQSLFPDKANDLRYLFSMIYLVIDTKERKIEYINAGHPSGLFVADDGEVIELDKGGLAIGSPFLLPFEKGIVHYRTRARLFLYTDGILDEMDSSILRSIEKIKTYTKMYRHLSDKMFLERMVGESPSFKSPLDDICLVSVTVHP